MRNRTLASALAACLALAAAAPGADLVRLSQTISTDAQIADEKGFFTDQGIKIQWTGKQAHGPAVLVTVAAGENDFAGTVTSSVVLARVRGAKLRIIAATSASSLKRPFFRYLVKDSSPIKSAKDFVGKKVVAQPTTITWYPLVVWLKHQGVDYNQVEFVSLPSPLATLQAFHEGKVDAIAAIDSAPPATMLLAEGGVHYVPGISDAEVLGVTQVSGWATTDDFIARHPGVVKRFVKALSLAVAWGNAHPAEAEAILNRLNDVPAAAAKYAAWRPGTPAVKVDPDSIRRWVSILEDFGQVKPGEVKPEDLYTNQFNP